MGKVKEQFDDVVSAVNNNVPFVQMWVGPRDAKEMERTIAGKPTIVPCCVGPNLNDGMGAHGFKMRKGFLTLEEMHRWIKDQDPDQQRFPCPQCDASARFVGKTANELVTHMDEVHPRGSVVSTPDLEGAKERAILKQMEEQKAKDEFIESRTERPGVQADDGLAEIVVVEDEPETQCAAMTGGGTQCKRIAVAGSDYCALPAHQKQGDR